MMKLKVRTTRGGATGFLKPLDLLLVVVMVMTFMLAGCGDATPGATATLPSTTATTSSGAFLPQYWPTTGWRTSTPEEQGVDSQQLLTTLNHIEQDNVNVRTLTVTRNGYILLEAANQPFTLNMPYQVYSVTKSVMGALVGIALHEGFLKDVNQKVLSFFPERTIANRDQNKEAITIEDLLTMRPGLDCGDDKLNGAMEASKDWIQFTLDLPMASAPGQKLVYCTAGVHLLSAILTKATGMPTSVYAQSRLFDPLGIASADVKWDKDPQGITIGGYGISMKPRDMTKFGLLYLAGGKWESKQVVPEDWVTASTRVHATGENQKDYGYLFWVYPTHFAAEGLGEQMIKVVKSRNMVVVMTSAIDWHKGPVILRLLEDYIIPAAKSDKPLSANPVALQSLRDKVAYLNNPLKPVQALPPIARSISGKAFSLPDNPVGWKNLTFNFAEGKAEVQINVVQQNGADQATASVAVGLDNVYRIETLEGGGFAARRAYWADEKTLVVQQIQSAPEIQETEARLEFSGDRLKLHVEEKVFGTYSYDFEGTIS
ncbi:MAG TPA: serine hydrolase [Chloroflexia bacterium]|nr:serine hydrolase [Chloroflexia bacterium]